MAMKKLFDDDKGQRVYIGDLFDNTDEFNVRCSFWILRRLNGSTAPVGLLFNTSK